MPNEKIHDKSACRAIIRHPKGCVGEIQLLNGQDGAVAPVCPFLSISTLVSDHCHLLNLHFIFISCRQIV